MKLARKEKPDAPDKINNGKMDVPSILQEPIAVDKDNMAATVVKDGYHTLEEVYKNVPKDQWPAAQAQRSKFNVQSLAFALSLIFGFGL